MSAICNRLTRSRKVTCSDLTRQLRTSAQKKELLRHNRFVFVLCSASINTQGAANSESANHTAASLLPVNLRLEKLWEGAFSKMSSFPACSVICQHQRAANGKSATYTAVSLLPDLILACRLCTFTLKAPKKEPFTILFCVPPASTSSGQQIVYQPVSLPQQHDLFKLKLSIRRQTRGIEANYFSNHQ